MQNIIRLTKSEIIGIINYAVDSAVEHGDDEFNESHGDIVHLIVKLSTNDVIGDDISKCVDFEIDNTK